MPKYENIRLHPVENGLVLRYSKMSKPENSNSNFVNSMYEECEEVFKDGEDGKAMARMKELKCYNMEKKDKE